MSDKQFNWPRIRNLPQEEHEPFMKFLEGQTRPWIDGEPESEQDGYYNCDYLNFKQVPASRYWD